MCRNLRNARNTMRDIREQERKRDREQVYYIALDGISERRPHETNCGTIAAKFPLVANLSGYAVWPRRESGFSLASRDNGRRHKCANCVYLVVPMGLYYRADVEHRRRGMEKRTGRTKGRDGRRN